MLRNPNIQTDWQTDRPMPMKT